ncbi:methyl-CpG-binding domain-containing protein [Dionaea muscipula]
MTNIYLIQLWTSVMHCTGLIISGERLLIHQLKSQPILTLRRMLYLSDKDDDNSGASSRKTIVEDISNREVSGSKDGQARNVESNLKGEQLGDGNYGDDYVSTGMVDHGDGIASEGSLSDSDSETTLLMDNVREVQFDEVVLHEDAAEPKCETGGDDAGNEMTGAADVQQRYSEEISAVSRGMTGVEDSMNGVVESTVKNYCVERGSEQSLFSPVDEFPTCEIEAYVENACVNSIKEPSPDILDSQKDESTVDGGSCSTKEKITESNLFLLSGGGGDGDSTVKNRASIVSSGMLPETKEDEVCKVDSFLPCIFYANQSSYENAPPNNTTVMKAEVPESDQGGNANGILFASGSNNRDRGSRIVTHNQQESIFAPLGRQTFTDESNVFATCDNILEDSQRRRVSKSILSCLSVNDHMQDITDGLHNSDNNVNAIPAGTDTLPELDKVESSRNNEVILDFVGNMGEINRSVLTSAQHGIISESSSHFSLWNEQSYSAVHTHNRGYDGTGEEVRQEQIPRSNSHSLASFQPTYDLGYNLNKSYIGTVEEFTRFDHSRDTDLMIGFNNNQARTNQHVATEDLWRSNDERVMPGSLGNSSSSQTQVSGSFRAFDILMDKGENGLFSVNEKFDGLSSFGGLRSAAVEPMEFSFLTGPSSSTQLEEPKVLSYNSAEMDQGFDSSLWFSKGTAVPNMISGHDRATMCVWCGNAFRLDSAAETQAGSIGHLCQTCKDRISGAQYM